jgi:hypothetical protein
LRQKKFSPILSYEALKNINLSKVRLTQFIQKGETSQQESGTNKSIFGDRNGEESSNDDPSLLFDSVLHEKPQNEAFGSFFKFVQPNISKGSRHNY